jgi:hypothetical protein
MNRSIFSTLLCVGFLLSSCNQLSKNNSLTIVKDTIEKKENYLKKDSSVNKLENETVSSDNVVHFSPIKVDTIIGDLCISYLLKDNESIIYTTGYDDKGNVSITGYADRSVFICLRKKNKNILLNREIKKTDFISIIPHKGINNYQLCAFQIKKVKNDGVAFFVNVCVPDTDNCYTLDLVISFDGAFTFKQIDESMED